ncbi:MAG: WD40 repeat domain-containing protein, partial [Blastocatellia bacterium]
FYEKLRERSGNEVVYLKSFDEAKIRSYLDVARAKPDEDWAKIEQIYDLKGLAQLPLLLTMITDSLDEFAPGEKVDAAKLYERYTDKWITRDFFKGRVILKRESKLKLMLELAWRIWNNPDQPMRYRELASFVDEMREAGVVEFRGHETEDIVAAIHLRSFLKREGETGFSFIHRSFMEYFLARRLFNGLNDEEDIEIGLLNTRRFNKRIIHFLTMIDRDDSVVPLLSAILSGGYQPNISENTLEILYWGGRIRCEMEEEVKDAAELRQALNKRLPRGSRLAGANLQGITLECADLTEADLTGADLTKANLNHARLDRAVLRDAMLIEASVENASARDADLRNADLERASFNQSDLTGSDLSETRNQSRESFVNSTLARVKGLSFDAGIDFESLRPAPQMGASGGVYAIAISPDGAITAVGSGDGVIRLYRTSDGALLRSLDGHSSSVRSVAFAPDGLTLASGSSDNSVKLWQLSSGKLLRSLDGHSSSVRSVAFAPDGLTLAS